MPNPKKKKKPALLGLPSSPKNLEMVDLEKFRMVEEFTTKHWEVEDTVFMSDAEDPEEIAEVSNLLREKLPRDYQIELFFRVMKQRSSILILPTGCGKTAVGMMVLQWMADANPNKLGAFLSPTIALVHQHYVRMNRDTSLRVEYLFGARRTEKMTESMVQREWQVISFTEGLFLELLRQKIIRISDFHTLIMDEAHSVALKEGRSSGYGKILEFYSQCPMNARPLLLSLSASPGACDTVHETMQLFRSMESTLQGTLIVANSPKSLEALEKFNRTVQIHRVPIPVDSLADEVIHTLEKYVQKNVQEKSRNRSHLRSVVNAEHPGDSSLGLQLRKWLKLCDSLELLGTPVIQARDLTTLPLPSDLLERVKASRSSPRIDMLRDRILQTVAEKASQDEFRGIVFVKRRETARRLAQLLEIFPQVAELKPRAFVGHGRTHDGMDAQEQRDCMEAFQNGQHRLLIATSVLEEGIDVPSCNFAVALEGSTSFRSFVQCRGRVRVDQGKFFVFGVTIEKIREYERKEEIMQQALHRYTRGQSLSTASWRLLDAVVQSESYVYLHRLLHSSDMTFRSERFHLVFMSPWNHEIDRESVADVLSYFAQPHGSDAGPSTAFTLQPKRKPKGQTIQDICSCPELLEVAKENQMAFQVLQGDFAQSRKLMWANQHQIHESWSGTLSFGHLCHGMQFEQSGHNMEPVTWKIDSGGMLFILNDLMYQRSSFESVRAVILHVTEFELHCYILLRYPPKMYLGGREAEERQGLTYLVTLPLDEGNDLIQVFPSIMAHLEFRSYHVWFAPISEIPKPKKKISPMISSSALGGYAREGLIQNYGASVYQMFREISDDWINDHPLTLLKLTQQYLWETLFPHTQSLKAFLTEHAPMEIPFTPTDDVVLMRSIIITPTRLYYKDPHPTPSNSVVRHFGSHDFIIVSFRDEDLCQSYPIGPAFQRLEKVCRKGLHVDGRHYSFLSGSNSQLRNQSCYFYGGCESIATVLSWIGDKPLRASLAFSASRELSLPSIEATVIPDVERNGHVFTDGTGQASRDNLEAASLRLGQPCLRSAMQIRYAGYKGVLLLNPTTEPESIGLRPSMRKFTTDRTGLSVLSVSGPSPAFLNAQLITLLESMGVPTNVFLELQVQYYSSFQEVHANTSTWTALSDFFPPLRVLLQDNASQRFCASFVHQLRLASFRSALRDPLRIYLPKARMALIVPDPDDILEENEVYFAAGGFMIHEAPVVVEGQVLLVKFPAHYPGDLLIRTAVNVPEWNDIYEDVIIVSTRGDRPTADQSSGGDYDGDRFLISWHPELVQFCPTPPFPSDAGKNKSAVPGFGKRPVDHFLAVAEQSTLLGRWSNYHLAASNLVPEGPSHRLCVHLNEKLRQLVDYPKTGHLPELFEDPYRELGVPGFMERPGKTVVECDRVCQLLYDRAERLMEALEQIPGQDSPAIQGEDLEGEEEWKAIYFNYCSQIEAIMTVHDIVNEADLFSGCYSHERWRTFAPEVAIVNEQLMKVWEETKKACAAGTRNSDIGLNYPLTQDPSKRYHSFSWLVASVMPGSLPSMPQPLSVASFGGSLIQYWNRINSTRQMAYRAGWDQVAQLQKELPAGFRAHLFGSRSQLLGNSSSDFDIAVTHDDLTPLTPKEEDLLWSTLGARYEEAGTLGPEIGRKYRMAYASVDVVLPPDGMRKRDLVLAYVNQRPLLLVALNIVLYWGRNVGLHHIVGNSSSYGLVYCVIEFALRHGHLQRLDLDHLPIANEKTVETILGDIFHSMSLTEDTEGVESWLWLERFLFAFFDEYQLRCPPRTPDPISPSKIVLDVDPTSKSWQEIFFQAAQCLHLYQDISSVLQLHPPQLDLTLRWEFFASSMPEVYEFEQVAPHADITLHSDPQHLRRWILTATGLPKHISPLRKYMKELMRNLTRGVRNSVFVEGSTHLQWMGYDPDDQSIEVEFKRAQKDYRMYRAPFIPSPSDDKEKEEKLQAHFRKCYLNQLYLANASEGSHAGLDIKLRFGGFTFSHLGSMGERLSSIPFSEVIESLQRGFREIAPRNLRKWKKRQRKRNIQQPRFSTTPRESGPPGIPKIKSVPKHTDRKLIPMRHRRDMNIPVRVKDHIVAQLQRAGWKPSRKTLQVHVHYPLRDHIQERQLIYREPTDMSYLPIETFEKDLRSMSVERTTGARVAWLAYAVLGKDSTQGFRVQIEAHQANDRADEVISNFPTIRIVRGQIVHCSRPLDKVRLRLKQEWKSPCGRLKADISQLFVWKKPKWEVVPRVEWTSHLAPLPGSPIEAGSAIFDVALDILKNSP